MYYYVTCQIPSFGRNSFRIRCVPKNASVAGRIEDACHAGTLAQALAGTLRTVAHRAQQGEHVPNTALSDTKCHPVWGAWRACLAGRLLAVVTLDRAVPRKPVMYGTGAAERVMYVSSRFLCVTQGTGKAGTGDVYQRMALNDDVGNSSGGTRDVRHWSRFDE